MDLIVPLAWYHEKWYHKDLDTMSNESTCSFAPMSDDVTKKPHTIVLCFDGTAGQYSGTVSQLLIVSFCLLTIYYWMQNTNIVKFFSLLKKDIDLDDQICYYQVLHFWVCLWSNLTRKVGWRRYMVQPWSCRSALPMERRNPRRGLRVVRVRDLWI